MRRDLDRQAAAQGWPALHASLARVDPQAAARIARGDSQRIQRALEVWQLTGRPLSSFHTGRGADTYGWMDGPRFFSLVPAHRAWLHQRIAQRFDVMLAAGLESEVRALYADPRLSAGLPALRCVGYRPIWETRDGTQPRETLRQRGIAATRQLAKRQLTWLRKAPAEQTLHVSADDDGDTLAATICERLARAA